MQQTLSVINLNAIRENALLIKERIGARKFYAVVKADAYGHGAVQVSFALDDITDGFCVALMREGAQLRIAGVKKPILVLTPPLDEEDIALARFYSLDVTINGKKAGVLSKGLACHIKINTGMNRYGCNTGELEDVLDSLKDCNVVGVYSHLYAPQDASASEKQLEVFNRAKSIVKNNYPDSMAHLSASGGVLLGDRFLHDGVRCGIALYGYMPKGFTLKGLRPALKVYARRSQTTASIGGGVGYSSAQKNYDSLSTYRAGYADGFIRNVPLGEGNLCMDGFISEKSDEWTCILDDADAYAEKCGTISYEILCSVTRRSERVYVNY